jgi:hypothetical protein
MILPGNENLKAKISIENPDHKRRLENLKSSLKLAYKAVARANRKSHENNKRLYDRKATTRRFEAGELVYLHNPSVKPGLTKKFSNPWKGPFKVTNRLSDLNYEIIGQNNKKQVVHINRLKKAYNQNLWKPEKEKKAVKKLPKPPVEYTTEEEEELPARSFPLASTSREVLPNQVRIDSSPAQPPAVSPSTDRSDPTYHPPETPRSKRELQITRNEPPITRSRARILSQDNTD